MTGASCEQDPAFSSVVAVKFSASGGDVKCTATQIAENVFLTAHHCVGALTGSGFFDCISIDHAYPTAGGFSSNQVGDVRDLALCFGSHPASIAKLPSAPGPVDTSAVTLAGYGLEYFAGQCQYGGHCRYIEDSASVRTPNVLVTQRATSAGDSGGPMFLGHLVSDGTTDPVLVGVLSAGSGGCEAPGGQEKPGQAVYTSLLWEGTASRPAPLTWIADEIAKRDRDGDGVLDHYDHCPDDSVPTKDSDGDGAGDACDDCPCDPDEINPWKDGDKDGLCGWCDGTLLVADSVCAAKCGGVKEPIDDCPGVQNPVALPANNCNAAAEKARLARVMSNLCDPVPCPDFTVKHEENPVPIAYGAISDGYVIGHKTTYQSELSPLSVHPIGSHGAPELADTTKRGVEVAVDPDWTEYRYCVHVPPYADCTRAENIIDSKIRLRKNRLMEDSGDAWHRVWLAENDFPGELFPDGTGTPGVDNPTDFLTYSSHFVARIRTWKWDRDFTYWHQRWSEYPTSPTLPPTKPNDPGGRFLAHAETTVGMTPADQNPYATGVHGKIDDFATPADSLANHLSYLWPVRRQTVVTFQRVPQWDPGMIARLCINCPMVVPVEQPDTCDHCGAIVDGPDLSVNEAQQIVLVRTATSVLPAVLLHDGSVMTIEDSVGTHLAQSLASGLTWVSAAEPDPMSGDGASFPAALGLSSDGTQLAEKLYISGHRAYGAADVLRIGDGEVPIGMMAAQQTEPTGPSAREAFQAVYSRSTGRLFLVGGQDATTHQLTHDIWWRDATAGSWQQIPLSAWKPERVLAATWSPVDRRLWLIEDTGSGWQRRERIVRVQPGTGEADVFGSWPRVGLFDQHWLVVDRDGSILVVASSRRPKKHVVVRIAVDADDDLHVEGVRVGQGTLAMAPVVDGEGYSFAITTGPTTLPRVVRLATLEGKHGQWGDVGQCF